MILSTALSATALVASPISAFNCAGNEPVSRAGIVEAYSAYFENSLAIVIAALNGDQSALENLVAPEANFTVFHGDVGIGPRSTGPTAAEEFFSDLAPTEFEFREASSGPFAVNPCEHIETEVVLRTNADPEVSVVKFAYDRGILTGVNGYAATVKRGLLQARGDR